MSQDENYWHVLEEIMSILGMMGYEEVDEDAYIKPWSIHIVPELKRYKVSTYHHFSKDFSIRIDTKSSRLYKDSDIESCILDWLKTHLEFL